MKELTTEEKAQRYDEAKINGSRLWECGEITRTNYEYIFPELTESEDDRIRKELIFYLGDMPEDTELRNGVTNRDVLAWLEKHKYTEDDLDKAYKCADEVQYRRGYEDAKKEIEKQDEQPIYKTPSRETILAIWDLGNEWKELTNGSISTEYGTQLEYIQKHWQESEYYLRAKKGERKSIDYENVKPQSSSPISYGKELEKRMNEACNKFFAPNTDVNRYSASDLFYAGVKAERDLNMSAWNEDDEKLFSRISGIIHNAAYQNYDLDVNGEEVGEYANIMRWLKSLKERVQPQVKQEWNPTDEQINTLFKYAEQNNKDGSILTSLYQELKKLRGE